MPHWEYKHLGWSYTVAIIGTIVLYINGILYIIEERVYKIKCSKVTSQKTYHVAKTFHVEII